MEHLTKKYSYEGDRLEPEFSETPGQWDAIWLRAGEQEQQHKPCDTLEMDVWILSATLLVPMVLLHTNTCNTEIIQQSE